MYFNTPNLLDAQVIFDHFGWFEAALKGLFLVRAVRVPLPQPHYAYSCSLGDKIGALRADLQVKTCINEAINFSELKVVRKLL